MRNDKHRAARLWLAAFLLSCAASAPAQSLQERSMEGWPKWLVKNMKREKKRLKYSDIRLGEGVFESRVPGKLQGEPEAFEGGWYFESDIGADLPLQCWVYTVPVDPAHAVSNTIDEAIAGNVTETHPLTMRQPFYLDAGAYDGAPYLAREDIYMVGADGEGLVGYAKLRVAVIDDITVNCAHTDHGFHETMARGFETMVREARVAPAGYPPFFEEIIVAHYGDQPVGFTRITYALDEDGDSMIQTKEAGLVPSGNNNISVVDEMTTEFARPDGSIIAAINAAVEDDVLTRSIRIDATEEGWWLKGTLGETELNQALSGEQSPLSTIAQRHAIRDLVVAESEEVQFGVWLPSVSPTRTLEAIVRINARDDDTARGELLTGPIAMKIDVDQAGGVRQGTMSLGPATLVQRRVWVEGEAP